MNLICDDDYGYRCKEKSWEHPSCGERIKLLVLLATRSNRALQPAAILLVTDFISLRFFRADHTGTSLFAA